MRAQRNNLIVVRFARCSVGWEILCCEPRCRYFHHETSTTQNLRQIPTCGSAKAEFRRTVRTYPTDPQSFVSPLLLLPNSHPWGQDNSRTFGETSLRCGFDDQHGIHIVRGGLAQGNRPLLAISSGSVCENRRAAVRQPHAGLFKGENPEWQRQAERSGACRRCRAFLRAIGKLRLPMPPILYA